MAHLACVGSRAINGVAALHTNLLETTVLRDFHELWPERFSNKTNGVTPRRFLMLANPRLTRLICDAIGDSWQRDLEELRRLEPLADDAGFRTAWRDVKRSNKERLADAIAASANVVVNPDSMFDVHAKRIHEYKRQHLNVLHIITMYARMLVDSTAVTAPRTFVFGGKAAPGYVMAKSIIQLIAGVADVVNNDPRIGGRLRVVLVPNFNVKTGQRIYPAADLAEQISTAGKEASGTGNMKFALNGALTIGTLDGANVEIRDAVGAENFFLFGLSAGEVAERRARGYCAGDEVARDAELRDAIDRIAHGAFSRGDGDAFAPLVRSLTERDEYLVLADYRAYVECQQRAGDAYLDRDRWTRMSILNVARVGRFSSDRAVREYCRDIWHVEPVEVGQTIAET
jgi:starch phosphorylase